MSAAATATIVPYEEPTHPDLVVDTSASSVTQCVLDCVGLLVDGRLLPPTTLLNAAGKETEARVLGRAQYHRRDSQCIEPERHID
jgi:hypothetical protein